MRFVEGEGFIYPNLHLLQNSSSDQGQNMNVSGFGIHFIGYLSLRLDKPGGVSKTLSAAGGGKIIVRRGTIHTLNNSGTTIRIGLQDVDTSVIPPQGDGIFTVYHESIGGSSTLDTSDTTFHLMHAPMHTGAKTVSHGDLVAVCIEMPTRGGTDNVAIQRLKGGNPFFGYTTNQNIPALRTGTGLTVDSSYNMIHVIIEFDDGTIGIITPYPWFYSVFTSSLSSLTTPDELGNLITISAPTEVQGIIAQSSSSSTNILKYCIYKNPFSSAPELVAEINRNNAGNNNQAPTFILFDEPVLLQPGEYVVSVQPQFTGNLTIHRSALSDPNYYYAKDNQGIGILHYAVERTGRSGAFSKYQILSRDQIIHLALLQNSVAVPSGGARFNMGI